MNEKELWNHFLTKQVYIAQPLHHKLVWVKRHDFENVKSSFVEDFNIFHIGRSFRSREYLLHIHCIDQGEYVLVHRDTGNIARFLPLGIIHFFFDVLPYVILALIKRVSFNSFFKLPH